MNKQQIIRAWKDPEYRASLAEDEHASLPACPSGMPFTGLEEAELTRVAGGMYAELRLTEWRRACGGTGNLCKLS